MGVLRISPDLFLGSQELNRFQKLLSQDGFRRLLLKNSIQFGLFHLNIEDGEFENFLVEQGTNAGTIKHAEGFALDANGELIYRAANDNIALPDNNLWHWIKVAYQADIRELGLCAIDASGNLTGDGAAEFEAVLRGLPNNPVKISFPDSTVNTGEYEVVEVIGDGNAVLAGDFVAESNVRYAVVGSFTPGISVPSASKYPFQYDGCLMTLVQEAVSNTPPALTDGEEFLIARVRRNGATITIQDKRSRNIYQSKSDFDLNYADLVSNPLIGVEAVKYNSNLTPRDKNLVFLGFGFRSSNWTIDSSVNRLTLIAGNGGKFKSTSDFTDGDFDGWRAYTKNGRYKIVKQSSLSATQINLILDSLDPDDFIDTAQELHIVPNAEQIELIFTPDPDDDIHLADLRVLLPINQGEVVVPLLVYKETSCQYNIKYRYKNFKTYTVETVIPSDVDSGYYTEAAFDDDGVLTGSTKQAYTSSATEGFITLLQAANSYRNIIDGLSSRQSLGVEYIAINTDSDPVIRFVVGSRREHVVITNDPVIDEGDSDFGAEYALTADSFLDLRTDTPSDLSNGNFFYIQLRGAYSLSGFVFNIVQNYVNSGDTGELLYQITDSDLDKAAEDNLIFKLTFDGTRWFVHKFVSLDGDTVTSSREINTTSPLTGGGSLAANRNLAINDAAADGATKGAAAFNASDFNSLSGVISLDYANGPVPKTRAIIAGSGLSGGGDLSADRTLDVNVDNSTIEINADTLRIKADGVGQTHVDDVDICVNSLNGPTVDLDTATRPGIQYCNGDAANAPAVGATHKFIILISKGDSGSNGNLSQTAIGVGGGSAGFMYNRTRASGISAWTGWTQINDPGA